MKKHTISLSEREGLLSILLLSLMMMLPAWLSAQTVKSPDGHLSVTFSLNDKGTPVYQVDYKGKTVINPSTLGIELAEENSLMDMFRINKTSTSSLMKIGSLYGVRRKKSVTIIMNFSLKWKSLLMVDT